jgi:hypothetical protein
VTHPAALSSTGWGFRQTPAHVFASDVRSIVDEICADGQRNTPRPIFVGIFRTYEGIDFPAIFNPVRPTRNLSQAATKTSESSHGHEHIIDHSRRDIFVRRVWLLWARALVLNGMPRSTQSAFISEKLSSDGQSDR